MGRCHPEDLVKGLIQLRQSSHSRSLGLPWSTACCWTHRGFLFQTVCMRVIRFHAVCRANVLLLDVYD